MGKTSDAVIYKGKSGWKHNGEISKLRGCALSVKNAAMFFHLLACVISLCESDRVNFERPQNFIVHYAFIIHSFLLAAVGDFVQEDELLGEVETDKVQQK